MRAAAVLLVAALGLTACVSVDAKGALSVDDTLTCPAGETRREVVQIFFGRNIGEQVGVSEADFTRFLDEEVSPRFPDGLTVLESQGRWLYRGVLYKEPGKVVNLILTGKPDDRRKVGEITAAYNTRFRQDAVLTETHRSCVKFWYDKQP